MLSAKQLFVSFPRICLRLGVDRALIGGASVIVAQDHLAGDDVGDNGKSAVSVVVKGDVMAVAAVRGQVGADAQGTPEHIQQLGRFLVDGKGVVVFRAGTRIWYKE